MNLFQIYLTDFPLAHLPPQLEASAVKLRSSFIDTQYFLWNDVTLQLFLQENFGAAVLKAYLNLIPYAYRSDLARYCLLYHFGGWYADLCVQPAGNHVIGTVSDEIDFIYFWDLGDLLAPFRSFYDCMNGLLFSRPGNPILATAIELVVKHSCDHYYGFDSMSPTGPGVLGRALAMHGKSHRHYDGHFIQLTPQHHQKNKAFVSRDGSIIAWHRSRLNPEATLADLGAIGTNDYRQIWRERRVYRDQV